ncbi:ParA family protein [Pseudomonas mendocina]|nr:ParA family protein [Pseudomonas mendocina]MBH3338747.1 ParA family protein [Pseudomonas mendocina]
MTKIITLYNHKGGVSKTTTTYHLAHALVEHLGKKVLVVDADPQCNITELFLYKIIEELDEKESQGEQTSLPGTSLKDALWPRLDGERADVDVENIELVKPCTEEELYIFRGDIALSEAEDRLSYAHSQRMTSDMHQKRNHIAIHDMLRRLGERDEFDYILVDVGPSAGALTRAFFLSCDEFLTPVAPDRYNFQAINSLSEILSKWTSEHLAIVSDFKKLKLNIAEMPPIFKGLIMQRYQRHNGVAKTSYQLWIDKIAARTTEKLIPSLIDSAGKDTVYPTVLRNPITTAIPDFASIAPMMLQLGKPAWRLEKKETGWQGAVWDDREKAMNEIRALFFTLAEFLEK